MIARWLTSVVLTVAAVLMLSGGLSTGVAAALDDEVATHPAMENLRQCIDQRRNLLVEFLMDESNSLSGVNLGPGEAATDPGDRRVDGGTAALIGLNQLGKASGTAVAVDLAGFAADYISRSNGWQELSDESLVGLRSRMDEFRELDKTDRTNYRVALEGARSAFADGAGKYAKGGVPPCKLLLWFTDGELFAGSRADNAAAKDAICNGGIVSDLRRDGVVTIAVGLNRGGSLGGETGDELARYAGEVEGCGDLASPSVGRTVPVDNLDDLIEFFDRIGTIGSDPIGDSIQRPVCPADRCDAGTHAFTVEPWRGRVHIFGSSTVDGVALGLQLPGGVEERFEYSATAQELDVGGTIVDVNWIDRKTVVVDARPTPQTRRWTGPWGVYFVGRDTTATVVTKVFLSSGLTVSVPESSIPRIGEESKISVEVVPNEGVPVTSDELLRSVDLRQAALRGVEGTTLPLVGDGVRAVSGNGIAFARTVALPPEATAGIGAVLGEIELRTSDGKVVRQAFDDEVEVRFPAEYPSVLDERIQASSVVGSDVARAVVGVGAGTMTGKVCFEQEQSDIGRLPSGVRSIRVALRRPVSGEASCLELDPGSKGKFAFELVPDGAGIGTAGGELVFRSEVAGEEPQRQVVKITVPMTRPIDEGTRWLVVLVLMVVGIGFPLLLLWLVARLQSRFRPTQGVRLVNIPVRLTGGRVVRRGSGGDEPLDVDPDTDVQWLRPSSEKPQSTIDVVTTPRIRLSAVKPRSPFGYPGGEASANGAVVVSSEGGAVADDSTVARVPLTLPGSWLFVRTGVSAVDVGDQAVAVDGHLVLFLSSVNFFRQVERLLAQAQDRLPLYSETLARRPEQQGTIPTGPAPPVPPEGAPSDPDAPFQDAPASAVAEPLTGRVDPPWDDAPPWSGGDGPAGGHPETPPSGMRPSSTTSSDPGEFEPPPWA